MMIKILDITSITQKKGLLCWAACIEMVAKTFAVTKSQKDIYLIRNTFDSPIQSSEDISNNFCTPISDNDGSVFKSLSNSGTIYVKIFNKLEISAQQNKGGSTLIEIYQDKILNNQPLILSNLYITGLGKTNHAVVLIGFFEQNGKTKQIAINDPYIFYNYPASSFNSCDDSILGGRACFIYQNLVVYNEGIIDYISVITNFNNNLSTNTPLFQFSNRWRYLTFPTLDNALNVFDELFLKKTFKIIIDRRISSSVSSFSITHLSSITDRIIDYMPRASEVMLMPLFEKDKPHTTTHLFEFIYKKEISHDETKFIPFCIRQPYFNGFLNYLTIWIKSNNTEYNLKHETPNYFLINIPEYGYNFIGITDEAGNYHFSPFEEYPILDMKLNVAYDEETFKVNIKKLNLKEQ